MMKKNIWLLAVGCWLLAAGAQAQPDWVSGKAISAKDSTGFEKTSATEVEAVSGVTTMTLGQATPLANHILGYWPVGSASGFIGWNSGAGPAYIKLYGANGGTISSAWETGLTSWNSGQTILNSGVSTPDMVIRHSGVKSILLQTNGANTGIEVKSDQSVAFPALADGSLSSVSGVITSSSDARLKNLRGSFSAGLHALKGIQPMRYTWNEKSGLNSSREYAGFVAQNVEYNIPEAVSVGKDGMKSLNITPILAAAINAINEQQRQIEKLQAEIRELKSYFQ